MLDKKLHLTKKKIITAGFFVVLAFYVMLIEPSMIENETVEIAGTGTNMTIAFLSDFQRRDSDPSFVKSAVDLVDSKNPDLVLLGGDYVESSVEELPSIEPLKHLNPKYGVYGVMGNHDYHAFGFARNAGGDLDLATKIMNFLENNQTNDQKSRITILRNEKAVIDDKVTIIGLDDIWAHLRDESKAYSDKEDVGYRILLSHNQDELDIKKENADLYLFGHTHCGQMRLPIIGSVPKVLGFTGEYDKGHFILDDGTHVYTTCGLAPAPRMLNPPEISIIRLLP